MNGAVCVDVGSTYTKACLVDLDTATLVTRAEHPTTAATDVLHGLDAAVAACDRAEGQIAEITKQAEVVADRHVAVGVIGFPFNMQKDSGFSRGGGYAAMREYTQEKAVAIRLLPPRAV